MSHRCDKLDHLVDLLRESEAKTTKKAKVESRKLLSSIINHCKACRVEILDSYKKPKPNK